jgi:hypothetical protein
MTEQNFSKSRDERAKMTEQDLIKSRDEREQGRLSRILLRAGTRESKDDWNRTYKEQGPKSRDNGIWTFLISGARERV